MNRPVRQRKEGVETRRGKRLLPSHPSPGTISRMDADYESDAITVVGVDADDTLWPNMPFYVEAEDEFCRLLGDLGDAATIIRELAAAERTRTTVG